MTTASTGPYRILIVLSFCHAAAMAEPWQLTAVRLDQPTALHADIDGLQVEQVTLRQTDQGPAAELEVAMAGSDGPTGLILVGFGAERRPLAAAYEQIAPPRLIGRRTSLVCRFRLTMEFGPLPDGEPIAYVAAGPMTALLSHANLLAFADGARVVARSSSYGGSFEPDRVLDGNPRTQWATETGKVSEEWLIAELAGGTTQRISGIGINPWGEPSYTDCALNRFTLQASTTGTEPGDFRTVISDACDYADQLQRFEFEPIEARYLKLLCHDNHGNDQWIEIASFEAYPADVPDSPPNGLALLLGTFAGAQAGPYPTGRFAEARREVDLFQEDPWYKVIIPPVDGSQTPPLSLVGCKSATAEWRNESTPDRELRFLNVAYDFGMLLGGARQLCAAIVAEMPVGRPARLQFEARPDPPSNRLRVVVWDSHNDWFEFGVEGSSQGWQRCWVDLDGPASKRGGGASPVLPLRRIAIGLAPKGREGTSGSLDVDDPILMYAAP